MKASIERVENKAVTNPKPKRFLQMPEAPQTTSPVPWLTSIHATKRRGEYGNHSYRGNCGGYLIKDLLRYYRPGRVFDPLCGAAHKGSCVAQSVMWRPVVPPGKLPANAKPDAT